MPYNLSDFKDRGYYLDKPLAQECNTNGGRVVRFPDISESIRKILNSSGGESHGGDHSKQDSAVITALLAAGYSPADTFATFVASKRGQFAAERKPGHLEDYVKRTIEKSAGYLNANAEERGSSKISVDFSNRREQSTESGIIYSMANTVKVEKVHWTWPQYIPAGKLTILAGDPSMGKSTIALDLISRISRGALLPCGSRGPTGMSIVASAEDSAEDTLTPRLIAAGANLSKVGMIREVKDDVQEDESRYLSFPRDLRLLKELLIKTGCKIFLIDPLNAFLSKGTDTYKDQDMRGVLHPMEMIAQETGTSIIIIAHLTKKEDTSTLYRVGGSIGFIAAARSVLGVTSTPDGTRVMYALKHNLVVKPPALSYETTSVQKTRLIDTEWLGESTINSSGIRWLGAVDFNPMSQTPLGAKAGGNDTETIDFLHQTLRDMGEMSVKDIYAEARQVGIPRAHLYKVRQDLGILAVKKGSQWVWQWPENASQD